MQERTRILHEIRARDAQPQAVEVLRQRFANVIDRQAAVDARFVDAAQQTVIGAVTTPYAAPVLTPLLADPALYRFLSTHLQQGRSLLMQIDPQGAPLLYRDGDAAGPRRVGLPDVLARAVGDVLGAASAWAGRLDASGRHVIDPRAPAPGPHFFTNLLRGNRIGFARPLQTPPKRGGAQRGRGSYRAHAATQVLATRWDLRPEENGFPANRQCYLVEDGRQIFYSALPGDENIASAETTHGQNRTVISYRTRCGLAITRTIFLLAAEQGLPLATEVQSISVRNDSGTTRDLRLVVTGMFGPAAPNALWEDVVYTTVSMQARVLKNDASDILAIGPHYHPQWTKGDERFHTTIVHQEGKVSFPTEYSTSYGDFVGRGTLERPEGLALLANRLSRKGPGFFALAARLLLRPGVEARADNFTCLISDKDGPDLGDEAVPAAVQRLVARFSPERALGEAMAKNDLFIQRYRAHLQVRSGDPARDTFVNDNLPFQILYQTFVSRSFDQTQKGYREIGFREIQDLFASIPYFLALGEHDLVKGLLKEWAGQIYEFGFANHNFYWTGKEPGDFSDDALWFAQAVEIYLDRSGEGAFLDERCAIAGKPGAERSIYEALRAVLRYSGEVSVGKHGLPLLDRADWNDTLRLDPEYLNGPQKEEAYRRQLAAGGKPGEPLATDNSESVMNAFLLKIAVDATRRFAQRRGDAEYERKLSALSARLADTLQAAAWKEDFFARVLINRGGRYRYLGAKGDGLSADPQLDGTYFLNSFTWAILAGVATEGQIRSMLGVIKRVLWTPHGLKLCSPVNFAAITARGGSAEYFAGDRENGGVFKHADMMAAVAALSAARGVADRGLARELRDLAVGVIDVVMPYRTLANPYVLAGNPRFCTQYNNSETGENVGPTLSGTAPWLALALNASYGLAVGPDGIVLDPVLPDGQEALDITLRTGRATYEMRIRKPPGFYRRKEDRAELVVDGAPLGDGPIPHFDDGAVHEVRLTFLAG